jgi:hypothetical protein
MAEPTREPTVGTRLRCPECGLEVIVTKLGEHPELVCHRPLEPAAGARPPA